MIISELVKINTNAANKKHFKILGYDITQKVLLVPICHLTKGSHAEILVKCDNCGNEKTTQYGDYLKKFNNGGCYVCKKCQQYKTGKTNIIKYGFECASQNEKTKEKSEITNFKRYGFKCSSKNDNVKNKMKQTQIEKYGGIGWGSKITNKKIKQSVLDIYGVEYSSQNKGVKEKIKQTNLERYGGILLGSEIIKEKSKQTNLKKYGVENVNQNLEIQNKIKQTNLGRYGGTFSGSNIIKEKIKKTIFERYGVEFVAQNKEIHDKMIKSSLSTKKYKETNLHYQGTYELDFLDKYYEKINIENGKTIKYEFNNLKKVYYPDFFIPELNLIVEIKSSHWYNKYLEKNIAKQKQCLKDGYQFIFIINKDYIEFEKILTFSSEI